MSPSTRIIALTVLTAAVSIAGYDLLRESLAQEGPKWLEGLPQQHDSVWLVHDTRRPKPAPVTPAKQVGAPPSDAIVLFGGSDDIAKFLWPIRFFFNSTFL